MHDHRDFTSCLDELGSIRAFVSEACAPVGLPEEALIRLVLAVNEIASNIILHAYRKRKDQPIEVEVIAGRNAVTVRLSHRGESFDLHKAPPPAFDGSRENGFGLYIVKECVDVRYASAPDGRHCVTLTMNICQSYQEES